MKGFDPEANKEDSRLFYEVTGQRVRNGEHIQDISSSSGESSDDDDKTLDNVIGISCSTCIDQENTGTEVLLYDPGDTSVDRIHQE